MKNNAELIICIIITMLIMYTIHPAQNNELEPEINSFDKVSNSYNE